jgi:hypothetical protein
MDLDLLTHGALEVILEWNVCLDGSFGGERIAELETAGLAHEDALSRDT